MKWHTLLILTIFITLHSSIYADEKLLIKEYTNYYPLDAFLVAYRNSTPSQNAIPNIVANKINASTYLFNDGVYSTYIPINYLPKDFELFAVQEVIPPSVITLMLGSSLPDKALADTLSLVTVTYIDYEGISRTGNLVVHKDLAYEVADIFKEIYDARFPIANIDLVDKYDADDHTSMIHNNTSAFNYRLIYGTNRLSNHSSGTSIDINPLVNPHVINGTAHPIEGSDYISRHDQALGMIKEGDVVYNAFIKRGWSWGGHWKNPDYQHFEK